MYGKIKNNIDNLMDNFIVFIKKFYSSERISLLTLNFVWLFLVFLKLLLSDYRIGYNDPGGDSAIIFNGAINIIDNKSYTFDSLWFFDEYDGTDRTIIQKPGYLYPPMTSLFLSLFLYINSSILMSIFFQIVIFYLLFRLYFIYCKKVFDREVAFFSTIIFICNPLILSESVSTPRSHILGLFFVLSFFTYYVFNKENTNYFLLGIISGFAYLTRDINLILLISFSIYLIINWRTSKLVQFLGGFIIISGPWILRNILYYSTWNPRSKTTGFFYNENNPSESSFSFLSKLDDIVIILHDSLSDFSSNNLFYLLSAFVIIGYFRYFYNNMKNPIHIYLIFYYGIILTSTLLSGDSGYDSIYLIPMFIILLPIGVKELIIWTDSFNSNRLNRNSVLILFISFIIIFSTATMIRDELTSDEYYDKSEDYAWSSENLEADSNAIVAGRSPHRFTYYTEIPSLSFPVNLDNSTFETFVNEYQIKYIYVAEHHRYDLTMEPYNSLFNGDEMEFETFRLVLIKHSFANYDGSNIWIYQIETIN